MKRGRKGKIVDLGGGETKEQDYWIVKFEDLS